MCPGMRPATRVDGVTDVDAEVGEHLGEVAEFVLGLGRGEAVAGAEDAVAGHRLTKYWPVLGACHLPPMKFSDRGTTSTGLPGLTRLPGP